MKREEKLTLGEFVTAPRKAVSSKSALAPVDWRPVEDVPRNDVVVTPSERAESDEMLETRTDAHKALRRLKRERAKGAQNFVNVHLDRETKRRLKFASFKSEISMQSLMETAIRRFLDDNGF
jgi:hypothetical protein